MLPFIFKPTLKELNKKLNFKPPISYITIDIRTKKTLEAKNRTNLIARCLAKESYIKLLNILIARTLARHFMVNAFLSSYKYELLPLANYPLTVVVASSHFLSP